MSVSTLKTPSAFLLSTLCLLMAPGPALEANEGKVDFARDILPLLSDNCFECHGPDGNERKAGLRLDQQDGAFAELESGKFGVVPNDLDRSEVYQRLITNDPGDQMPPPDSGKKLTETQKNKIRDWINSGAEWAGHWSFEPPEKPPTPAAPNRDWKTENAIDVFIQEGLTGTNLSPEDEADKETLIRRVTLDLTGLPPTIAEVDAFLADDSNGAYERLVDRLLRSKRYGEHMARIWLDAARYADTHGLHLDNERSVWPYRDWVINAYNNNQPFDEFTIEQLAGDLLPKPSVQQRVATGFNRCNVTTGEGGSIDAEYYVRYAVDRVETTSTVWLGLTAGCAACHDHKFDPLTQKEFYQLFSYFYSLTEKAMDGNVLLPPPSIKVPTQEQSLEKAALTARVTKADKKINALLADLRGPFSDDLYIDLRKGEKLGKLKTEDHVWVDDSLPEGAKTDGDEGKENSWKWVKKGEGPVHSGNQSITRTAEGLSQHLFTEAKAPLVIQANNQLFAHVYLDPDNPPETVQLQYNDGSWEHRAYWGADKGHAPGRNNASNLKMGSLPETGKWVRLEVAADAIGLKPGAKINGIAFTQYGGTVHWDTVGLVTVSALDPDQLASLSLWEQYRALTKTPSLPKEVQKALDVEPAKRNPAQKNTIVEYYLKHINPKSKSLFAGTLKKQGDLKKQLADLEKAIPATLVMEDRKEPRQAHILERGEYTMQREKVQSRVPEWIAPAEKDSPPNRLGLAQWLVNGKNPLTARVIVNRYWQQLFGTGLVKTSEDFGVQGEQPSHPELIDWLAVDFVESGWDVKRFLKMLAMSATYRQSSRVTPEKLENDPENRLLARGPRFRLDAEVIRDQALAISDLLVDKTGGRSVKPYQPAGLWKPVGFGGSNTSVFKADTGAKLYRRSMYTFWKRTSPPPTMATFDAPNRETCQVRRARTNTPLQALVLMNDVQFIEAARKFAEKVVREGGHSLDERLSYAVRSVLSRRPNPNETESLTSLFEEHRAEFDSDEEAAKKLLTAGESPRDESLDPREVAAWTMITHLLFNLSETVTKG
ncbi:MAG: PSD1 and planctomycete cytochrome C domain-containing protein [Verrucomicrobiota bacterium]